MSNYDDIINLNRPISKHPQLSMDARASQFAPFAALVGYDKKVKEAARLTEEEIILDDDNLQILDNKLNYLSKHKENNIKVSVTYFVNDDKKVGGKYVTKCGIIKRIDSVNGFIKFINNDIMYVKDIIKINVIKEEEDEEYN